MKILKEAYYSWGAEGLVVLFTYAMLVANTSSAVVFITSNYTGNSEIMQGCKEEGIPAFGTLWDFVSVISQKYPDWWRLICARSDRMTLLYTCLLPLH